MKSIRNNADMSCIAMPEKFRRLGDFANYYNGKKVAPVLTIFIGGNHEASNYLRELYFFFSKGNRLIKILWRLGRSEYILPWFFWLR
jgi:lariat debranching enzyme